MLNSQTGKPLILGCGYVGHKLSQRLQALEVAHDVSSRNPSEVTSSFVSTKTIDLDRQVESISNNMVWYFCPPAASGVSDQRIEKFLHHYSPTTTPAKVVYISTTGTYGNCNGEWVNEESPTHPGTDRARRRLDAEQQLQQWCHDTNNHYIILRVAGIYGPGRLPLQRLQDRQPMISEQEAPWSNRIHVDDLVEICLKAMSSTKENQIYNVADGSPTNMAHYFNALADKTNLPRPPLVTLQDPDNGLSAGMLSYLNESRRIDNSKVLKELDLELQYPDLEGGLDHALAGTVS